MLILAGVGGDWQVMMRHSCCLLKGCQQRHETALATGCYNHKVEGRYLNRHSDKLLDAKCGLM